MRYLVLLPALALLAACATLNEDQCRAGNWYEIGINDGAKGRSSDFIFQHAKACNEFGIAPKAAPWREGRNEGLKQYCTPTNAYRIGQRGQHLNPVCTGDKLSRLLRANDRGLQWFHIESEIRQTRAEIQTINTELATMAVDDPGRGHLISQRGFLRLRITRLRARQGLLRP